MYHVSLEIWIEYRSKESVFGYAKYLELFYSSPKSKYTYVLLKSVMWIKKTFPRGPYVYLLILNWLKN